MMKIANYFGGLLLLALTACQPAGTDTAQEEPAQAAEEQWRATIALNDSVKLPFTFTWQEQEGGPTMIIENAGERIVIEDIEQLGSNYKLSLPVFATYLTMRKEDSLMQGFFVNPDAENYRLAFRARRGAGPRFRVRQEPCCDLSGKWATYFNHGQEEPKPALGFFEQEGSRVTGSFATETGDYRYLEGVITGDSLYLSTFDGIFLYRFNARLHQDTLYGEQYSGRSGYRRFKAYRDASFALRDADSLTYLKEGYRTVDFSFPDLQGKNWSLSDSRFSNKGVIIQIMGSWCPNCMDESRYLKQQYEKYHEQGLEVVGLTFELAKDSATALSRARKMAGDLDLPYPILMAGYTRAEEPEEALPMLNHIMSFPTAIYLNPRHEVVKIHTGFAGPGTPLFGKFVEENEKTILSILP